MSDDNNREHNLWSFGWRQTGRLGVVFRDFVSRLAAGVGKPKSTPIFPFVFHFYDSQGLLTDKEETDYKMAQELAGYWITPEPKSRPESEDKGQANIPAASPIREEPPPTLNRLKQMKKMYWVPQGSLLIRSKGEGSRQQPEAQLESQSDQPQPDHPTHMESKK